MATLEKFKGIIETVKSIAEIMALIVAGLWAFSNYQEAEKPSLEHRASSESSMLWFKSVDKKHCLGSFGVKIKNIGKKAINLDKAVLRVWIVGQPPLERNLTYLNPEQFNVDKPIFEKSFNYGADKLGLLGHFPPDTDGQTDFTFDFEKNGQNIALFSFEAFGGNIDIRERRWSYICDFTN